MIDVNIDRPMTISEIIMKTDAELFSLMDILAGNNKDPLANELINWNTHPTAILIKNEAAYRWWKSRVSPPQ